MTLVPGTRLGTYEILAQIGAGGMGEVFRAKDTRLDRLVAIKLLPPHLQESADALARFEREAKAVAALNHPNILAIYEFGREGSIAFAAMELLEGETLRERLRHGPLSPRKAAELALQMAQGLAAAHDKGIVHRDLKPDNIFLGKDGRVKLLDFGLAKQAKVWKDLSGSQTPTALERRTDEGLVLGTVGYMSPEQVRGNDLDHRSDIFSFGSVLYEMLSGARAFERDTAVQTLSAILTDDPPEMELHSGAFLPALDRILRHCLEKHPEQRFQSAHDLAFALQATVQPSAISTGRQLSMADPGAGRRAWRWGVAAFLVAGAVAGAAWLGRTSARTEPPRFHQLSFRRGTVYSARFAPDGQTVLYSAAWEGGDTEVYTTRLDFLESRPLGFGPAKLLAMGQPGESGVLLRPRRVSPGAAEGTLALVPLTGGTPKELAEGVVEADHHPATDAWALALRSGDRFRVEYPKGHPLFETTGYVSHLRISPDGASVAFLHHPVPGDDRGFVTVASPGGKPRMLGHEWSSAQGLAWSPDGREVWFTASEAGPGYALHAVDLFGRARTVLRIPGGLQLFDIHPDGRVLLGRVIRRVYALGQFPGEAGERDLSWLDATETSDLSADGKQLLFFEWGEAGGPSYTTGLRRVDGGTPIRLGPGSAAALSPDGKWAISLVFGAPSKLMLLPTGAGEPRELPAPGMAHQSGADWLPDARHLVLTGSEGGKGARIWVQDLEGGTPQPITPEGVTFDYGAHPVSPDGQWVAAVDGAGKAFLYPIHGGEAQPLPGIGAGDQIARWAPDGKAFFVYRLGNPPLHLDRYELGTHTRRPFREVKPLDPAGVALMATIQVTPDGRALAYTLSRMLTDLYLVEGLK